MESSYSLSTREIITAHYPEWCGKFIVVEDIISGNVGIRKNIRKVYTRRVTTENLYVTINGN